MKIIKPYFEFMDEIDGEKILQKLERCGRVCYKSENKITVDSAKKFIAGIIKGGHESVIEHEKVTVRVICDRGVTHEIVRHRIASYSQESTRYCNYTKENFGGEIATIEPFFFERFAPKKRVKGCPWVFKEKEMDLNAFDVWFIAILVTEWAYGALISDFNRTPQEARSVLPNSLKTEIVVTANLREWRHFLKLRCSKKAHPQMREIVIPLLREFQKRIPVIFDDINPD